MLVATTKDPKQRLAAAIRKAQQFGSDYPIGSAEKAKLCDLQAFKVRGGAAPRQLKR